MLLLYNLKHDGRVVIAIVLKTVSKRFIGSNPIHADLLYVPHLKVILARRGTPKTYRDVSLSGRASSLHGLGDWFESNTFQKGDYSSVGRMLFCGKSGHEFKSR